MPRISRRTWNTFGLAHASRYNSQGCDINRDFEAFRTVEARAIRQAIDLLRPRLVVALHEGPQDGLFGIPLVTVEIPWSWPSMEERIRAQTVSAFAAADAGAVRP